MKLNKALILLIAVSSLVFAVNCSSGDKKENPPITKAEAEKAGRGEDTKGCSKPGGDCINGIGEKTTDAGKYIGKFSNGRYDGTGSMEFPNGDSYKGDFKNDSMNGKGVYKFANGDVYEGEFKDGKFNGYGVLLDSKGNKYAGFFAESKFNGKGVYTTRNGRTYDGDFKDDALNGRGIVREKDGRIVYDGKFENGRAAK
jgi:hypothetical protein